LGRFLGEFEILLAPAMSPESEGRNSTSEGRNSDAALAKSVKISSRNPF